MPLLSLLLGQNTQNLKVAVAVSAILCIGNRVGASLAVVLGHILALPERSTPVLQHMADAEGVAIEPSLLAQLGAVRAQWLVIQLRVVDVFAFIHPAH